MDDDLDISWIQKNSKLHEIQHNFCKENMQNIWVHCIYINCANEIEKIASEKHECDIDEHGSTILSKERMLKFIQTKKQYCENKKYKLSDILSYQVDLEAEHMQSYSQITPSSKSPFFKTISVFNDIVISPSIFIFHSLNAIYVCLQEIETVKPILKPILKIGGANKIKHTKKVRIMEDHRAIPQSTKNKTRKFLPNNP